MPPKFLISYQETRFLVTACFHYKITFHREHLWRDRKETGNSEPLRGMGGRWGGFLLFAVYPSCIFSDHLETSVKK